MVAMYREIWLLSQSHRTWSDPSTLFNILLSFCILSHFPVYPFSWTTLRSIQNKITGLFGNLVWGFANFSICPDVKSLVSSASDCPTLAEQIGRKIRRAAANWEQPMGVNCKKSSRHSIVWTAVHWCPLVSNVQQQHSSWKAWRARPLKQLPMLALTKMITALIKGLKNHQSRNGKHQSTGLANTNNENEWIWNCIYGKESDGFKVQL